MKLITEVSEEIKFLTEADEKGEKKHFIEGVFMQAELKNRNGRVYPHSVLEREVNKYNKEFVKENRAFGELSHPDSPQINPERVSHRIVQLEWDKNDVYGKARVLNTPMGNIVRGLMEDGGKLGVSSRGVGSLKRVREGLTEVQGDFQLVTVDIVTDPSAPSAFVNGVMENREYIVENGVIKERVLENYKKIIRRTKMNSMEKVAANLFEDFMRRMANKK